MAVGTPNGGNHKVALAALDAAAGVLTLLNPEGVDLIVTRLILDVTTKATAACTVDAGIAATAVSAQNLLDELDVGTAAGVFDNHANPGTNGKKIVIWPAGQYLTVSRSTGAAAGLVGNAYVEFTRR